MNIKQLKSIIENLPDEMPVVECRSGNVSCWTDKPDISVKTVYKFNAEQTYGTNKGSLYEVEFTEVYKNTGKDIISEYQALVFYTQE